MLKTIESMAKTTNLILRIRIARRWLHVDFLEKITIEKCIFSHPSEIEANDELQQQQVRIEQR